jgi:hypothetical protein
MCVCRLGLVSDDPVDKRGTPIDTLSNYLAKRLAYGMYASLYREEVRGRKGREGGWERVHSQLTIPL